MDFNKVFFDVGEESPYKVTAIEDKKRNEIIEGFQKISLTEMDGESLVPRKDLFVTEGDKLHGASKRNKTYIAIHQQFSQFPQDKIFYSIVNRNTAHQMSYFLAQYAFKKFGIEANEKIVINIDQHNDYGDSVSNSVKFSCWGRNILDKIFLDVLHSSKATYNVIGVYDGTGIYTLTKTIDLSKSITTIFTNKKKFNISDVNLAQDIINHIFSEKIKNGITSLNKSDIYISFDTDAMQKSNTCYKSGILENSQVLKILQGIFDIIKEYGDRLVGIDVTGLPINNKIYTYDCDTYEGAFENTQRIIECIKSKLISF